MTYYARLSNQLRKHLGSVQLFYFMPFATIDKKYLMETFNNSSIVNADLQCERTKELWVSTSFYYLLSKCECHT